MMDDGDLFPCPFCGSDGLEVFSDVTDEPATHWVECVDCASRGPSAFAEKDAAEWWNDRQSDP